MSTSKSKFIERHAGFAIRKDGDGFFWENGSEGDWFDTIEECRADIDRFNQEDYERYADIDTPPDTPSLGAPWWSHV